LEAFYDAFVSRKLRYCGRDSARFTTSGLDAGSYGHLALGDEGR